jgi:hypothetical protein
VGGDAPFGGPVAANTWATVSAEAHREGDETA